MAEVLKDLAERGFIRVNKPRTRPEAAPQSKENGKSAESGKVEPFSPRIRVIGLD
jgi:hypothetical protein